MTGNSEGNQELENKVSAVKGNFQQFLTFTVGDEEYGVDIMTVLEIKGWTPTTRLPNSQDYMRGVMNLRGAIIPIFDLRTRFHQGETEVTPKHVVIVLAIESRNIGILVDTVSDILDVDTQQIKPAPSGDSHMDSDYINGLISLDNRMVVLLDVEHLFDGEQIEHILEKVA
ncbi:MAG: chemotaxis protein CheW [Rickettsiales bacterium]